MSLKKALFHRVIILSLIISTHTNLISQELQRQNAINEMLKRRDRFSQDAKELFLLLNGPQEERLAPKMAPEPEPTPIPTPKLNTYACKMRTPSPTPEVTESVTKKPNLNLKDLEVALLEAIRPEYTSGVRPEARSEIVDAFSDPIIQPSSLAIISSMLSADEVKDPEETQDEAFFDVPTVSLSELTNTRTRGAIREMNQMAAEPAGAKKKDLTESEEIEKARRRARTRRQHNRYSLLCCACPGNNIPPTAVESPRTSPISPTSIIRRLKSARDQWVANSSR